MSTCPHCTTILTRQKSPSLGLIWVCPTCHGRAMTLELLRKAVPQQLVNRLWQRARAGQHGTSRSCPACKRRMADVPIIPARSGTMHLDVCTGCHFVWFDPQEFEALPKLTGKPAGRESLSEEAKKAQTLAELEALKSRSDATEALDAPDDWWQLAGAICGMPIEYNDTPLRNAPIVTWLLAAVIAVVSLVTFRNLEPIVREWGLIPAEFSRHFGLTFVTSFFLHGGLFHLFGNLYFLIVFGDNTEDVLGKRRFLLLVAVSALVGDMAHILVDPRATVPCIGASGGISGVLAYYCLRFPTASVGIIWWFRWLRIPVGVMFAMWVLFQIFDAFWIMEGIGNVAVFAHLGGAGVGVLFWWWTRHMLSVTEPPESAAPLKAP